MKKILFFLGFLLLIGCSPSPNQFTSPAPTEMQEIEPVDTVAPTLEPTAPPTPLPILSTESYFDNFDNESFVGGFDSDIWYQHSGETSTCVISQSDGKMVFQQTAGLFAAPCYLETKKSMNWHLDEIDYLEAQLLLSGREGEAWSGLEVSILSNDTKLGENDWWLSCNISQSGTLEPLVNCSNTDWDEMGSNPGGIPASLDKLYTFRITVDPETVTFNFYIDGYSYASFTPPQADQLRDDSFYAQIGLWNEPKTTASGYVDEIQLKVNE